MLLSFVLRRIPPSGGCGWTFRYLVRKTLIEPDKLKSRADWIEAGSRIFTEFDDLHLRTVDPKIVAAARSRATFEAVGAQPLADGTVYGLRWVPTERGFALSSELRWLPSSLLAG
jgi:hypothetical protein